MRDIQITVRALTNDPRTDQQIVWLGDAHGKVLLPLIVGGTAAVSIYLSETQSTPTRPLTHDLIASCLDQFHTPLQEVRFDEFVGEVLDAELVLSSGEERFTLRARPSDAVALALRCDAPIFMSEAVLSELGIEVPSALAGVRHTNPSDGSQQIRSHGEKENPKSGQDRLAGDEKGVPTEHCADSHGRLRELQRELVQAVQEERYEQAGEIKRQIMSITECLRRHNG